MDAVQAVQEGFAGAHVWFNGTVADVTSEQANQLPSGSAHPIGALITHILHAEDGMLSMFVIHKPMLYESEGWAGKLGLPVHLDFPADRAAQRYDPALLAEYGRAVFAQTDAYLAGLTPEALDVEADFTAAGMGKMPLSRFLLTMLLGNTYAHTGEISAMKGLLGAKGYPF